MMSADAAPGRAIIIVCMLDNSYVSTTLCITYGVAGVGVYVRCASALSADVTIRVTFVGVGMCNLSYVSAALYVTCGVAIVEVYVFGLSRFLLTQFAGVVAIMKIFVGCVSGITADVTRAVTVKTKYVIGNSFFSADVTIGVARV